MSKYQIMPPLSDEQYEALKADISTAGVRVPIEVDEHGEVIDGHHRRAIAMELGIECPETVIRGLEEFEKIDRAFVLNATRRHFNREQQRAVIVESLKRHPRLADREHARRCGVSHPTVADVRAALVAAGRLESFTSRIGGDGRERPAHNEPTKTPPAPAEPEIGKEGATKDGGPVAPSTPLEPQDHPTPPSGDAAEPLSRGADELGDEAEEETSDSSTADGLERQEPAGVSGPAAPAPKRGETEEEQKAREEREMREARSLEFVTGLVNVRMRLEPDPVRWYQNVYIRGLHHARDLPRVRDSFTPTGIRQAARFLETLAAHLEEIGEEL